MSNHVACINMIKQQLRTGDVFDESILELYNSIPREEFVPPKFKSFAYSDMQIPLAHDQYMMTPLEEAILLQALQLKGHETVLEVGTGTGFLTALLSRLSKKVVSIDCFPDFTKSAQKVLGTYNCLNVELITGDASQGWLDLAPYDVIIYTSAVTKLNQTQRLQLLPGGKFFAIVGSQPVMQGRLYTLSYGEQWQSKLLFETALPSLIVPHKIKHFVF
jgi:protein-L-isoaspartate(D-aspartate) O-methyltransferase